MLSNEFFLLDDMMLITQAKHFRIEIRESRYTYWNFDPILNYTNKIIFCLISTWFTSEKKYRRRSAKMFDTLYTLIHSSYISRYIRRLANLRVYFSQVCQFERFHYLWSRSKKILLRTTKQIFVTSYDEY